MDEKIVIVIDLGAIKAFRLNTTLRGSLHLEPLQQTTFQESHQRILDRVTDLAGRRGSPTLRNWGSPIAEQNKVTLETERRLIKNIVNHIIQLAKDNPELDIWMAAPKDVNHRILEALPAALRQRIQISLSRDLVNATKRELLESFAPPRAARVPVTSGKPADAHYRETQGSTTKRRQPRFHSVLPTEG